MMRVFIGLLLVLHGLAHAATGTWATSQAQDCAEQTRR
jgi:hypothetical protein